MTREIWSFGDDADDFYWLGQEPEPNCIIGTPQGDAVDLSWFESKVVVDDMIDFLTDYFFDDGAGSQILVKYPDGRVQAVWEHQLRQLLAAIR